MNNIVAKGQIAHNEQFHCNKITSDIIIVVNRTRETRTHYYIGLVVVLYNPNRVCTQSVYKTLFT